MNKTFGPAAEFALIKSDCTRTIVSYEKEDVAGSYNATWREVYFPKKQVAKPTFDQIRDAIEADINAQTDEKILTGFVWTPEGGEPIKVWLSMENQSNYSEAYHIAERKPEAILPVTFKLGELADKTPVYHTFETFAELESFYLSGAAFKNQCLNEGWQRKDSIDWSVYEQALNHEEPKKKGKK